MSHEVEIYQDEIRRLKERVNTLITILERAAYDEYDPESWIKHHGGDWKKLDKEQIDVYTT